MTDEDIMMEVHAQRAVDYLRRLEADRLPSFKKRFLDEVAMELVKEQKKHSLATFDTGRMRNSIDDFEENEDTRIVGPTVLYAKYVTGVASSYIKHPNPFHEFAADEVRPRLPSIAYILLKEMIGEGAI